MAQTFRFGRIHPSQVAVLSAQQVLQPPGHQSRWLVLEHTCRVVVETTSLQAEEPSFEGRLNGFIVQMASEDGGVCVASLLSAEVWTRIMLFLPPNDVHSFKPPLLHSFHLLLPYHL
jgi:hypothetical protein